MDWQHIARHLIRKPDTPLPERHLIHMSVLSNSTIAVLMDALGNQGVRRLRQVMSDRETREDLVQLAHRMFEVYPSGLCPTIAHDIMEINIEYYQEKKGSQR
jgi:hypothetical protein